MSEQEYADFNNHPICGDVKNFIALLASIAIRINNTQEDKDDSK